MNDRKTIESTIYGFKGKKALVIGDLMLDEYLWGKTERISPEAPVQVVDVIREELRLGGAGNVVNNLSALGLDVSVASVIGDDNNGWSLIKELNKRGIETSSIFLDPDRSTSRKTRVVASHQQIVRIDRESRNRISEEFENRLTIWITENISRFDVLIISDYLKGVLTEKVLKSSIDAANSKKIAVLVDPKGDDYSKYANATILTPNRKEAEAASKIKISSIDDLHIAADKIMQLASLQNLLITRSEEGMTLFSQNAPPLYIDTVAKEVFDVSGAGDTVLAALSASVAAGASLSIAAMIANIAAGIAVSKLGTSIVSAEEILEGLKHEHIDTENKIKNLDSVVQITENEKKRGKKIVFTNGCFDLLHAGHVKYLQKARKLGDILVLGLNSDSSVRKLKGEKRPLISEDERAHLLAALNCIDYVVIFDEETPKRLIEAIKPDILAKGGDYTVDSVVGADFVISNGGRVELVTFVEGKSTTNIIGKILETYNN